MGSKRDAALRVGRLVRPATRGELRLWVRSHAGLMLPEQGVCAGHNTPLDYLEHVFFELGETGDTVVWACRGGGKTMVGAVATLLDLLFKPGIKVRILGGSKEQSEKMYDYLCALARGSFADQVRGGAGAITRGGFALRNGSRVEILAQSECAVRGTRVQKLRCDELELFDEKVWAAAQLTTRGMGKCGIQNLEFRKGKSKIRSSKSESRIEEEKARKGDAGGQAKACTTNVRGAVEVFSTMHRPLGLMSKVAVEGTGRKIFRWCVWDVVGRCEEEKRSCAGCALAQGCGSRARGAKGFLPMVDVLEFQKRSSGRAWESEMLCGVPRAEGQVFGGFRAGVHVREWPGGKRETRNMKRETGGEGVAQEGSVVPGMVVEVGGRRLRVERVIAGIDYGWQKFVCLWLVILRDEAGERVVWAVDEYVMPERSLEAHAGAMLSRGAWGVGEAWKPAAYFGDAAGRQHDAHSGETSEGILRKKGIVVRSRVMKVAQGIEVMGAMIDAAVPRLLVDPRCPALIAALGNYVRKGDVPVKDGEHDHLVDALRYGVMGEGGGGKVEVRGY